MTVPPEPEAYAIATDSGADATVVGAFIAEAFAELSVARWLIVYRGDRVRVLADQFALLASHARDSGGHIDLAVSAGDGTDPDTWVGVGVWADRTTGLGGAPADYDDRLAVIAGPHFGRLRALDEAFDAHHPHDIDHHHLMFLAVAASHQGNGIGTGLLAHGLARADQARVPVYLEASNTRSRDLYARHGFASREPILLPAGPELYPMLRPAA